MSSRSPQTQGSASSPAGPEARRKGSVKRAREQLAAGTRPTRASPPVPRPPPVRLGSHQTQWPLPASGLQPRPVHPNQHPRFLIPRGPPPARPPRPSEVPSQIPSPSVYSVRSGRESEASYANRPVRSFSHPKPPQQPTSRPSTNDGSCPSPTSTVDMTPRISIATDELFRHSNISTTSSAPGVPPMPSTGPPPPPAQPRQRTAGLVPPPHARHAQGRNSSVSPIPESGELSNPRQTLGSLASSRAMPSSWGSGPAESEILGAYLDVSDSDEHDENGGHGDSATLVRNASVGKRGKPTMRTFSKNNTSSEASEKPSANPKEESNQEKAAAAGTHGVGVAIGPEPNASTSTRRVSASTASNESYIDPEKPRFARLDDTAYNEALQKEIEALPKAAPTISDMRPAARRPPRLDMNAVRDAEARGSLSSLSDLIRRATKLASNLDRGKTASRADLAADDDFKNALGRGQRRSGSLSDMLASFPNPGLATPDNRGSWPVFFSRSNPRNAEPLKSNDDGPDAKRVQRKCCGIPRKWFIILCILLFIIVVLAILLPVFLVAVPKQNSSSAQSCSQTKPCQNGGVSVSSGTQCSCVCSNGYTGAQCTIAGDSSCVTSEVDNGTITKKATMGSSLPTLFSESQQKFGINLDSVTIMALFSMRNVSCKAENALIAFSDVKRSNSNGNSRRSIDLPLDLDLGTEDSNVPSQSVDLAATGAALAARSTATSNGIVYDNSLGSESQGPSAPTPSTSILPTTQITSGASATTETKPASGSTNSTTVPDAVVEFSQVAVLYILQKTGSFDSALYSESQIGSFLTDSYGAAMHPRLELLGTFGLNFENRTISVRNGTLS